MVSPTFPMPSSAGEFAALWESVPLGDPGWLGGDGCWSVLHPTGGAGLFTFGDTPIQQGSRTFTGVVGTAQADSTGTYIALTNAEAANFPDGTKVMLYRGGVAVDNVERTTSTGTSAFGYTNVNLTPGIGTVTGDQVRAFTGGVTDWFPHGSAVLWDAAGLRLVTGVSDFVPADTAVAGSWYWPGPMLADGGYLWVFPTKQQPDGAGSFTVIGRAVFRYVWTSPSSAPSGATKIAEWGTGIGWGASVVQLGSYNYIYGTVQVSSSSTAHKVYVARCPAGSITAPTSWEFLSSSLTWVTGSSYITSPAGLWEVVSGSPGTENTFSAHVIGSKVVFGSKVNGVFGSDVALWEGDSPSGPFTPRVIGAAAYGSPTSADQTYLQNAHLEFGQMTGAGGYLVSVSRNQTGHGTADYFAGPTWYRPLWFRAAPGSYDTSSPAVNTAVAGQTMPDGMAGREALILRLTAPWGSGRSVVVAPAPDDLQFGSAAPGGFTSLTATIPDQPLTRAPEALTEGAIVQVQDRRNGQVVWHGRLTDPGERVTSGSSGYQIAAQGEQTQLDTSRAALAYVDRTLDHWIATDGDYPQGQVQQIGQDVAAFTANVYDSTGTPYEGGAIQQSIPEGSKLLVNSQNVLRYLPARYTNLYGQKIVLFMFSSRVSAALDSSLLVHVYQMSGPLQQVLDVSWSVIAASSGGQLDHYCYQSDGAGWTYTDVRHLSVRWQSHGSTTSVVGDQWIRMGNLTVIFQRVDRDGVEVPSASTYVYPYMIVDDVIGRLLKSKLEITWDIDADASPIIQQATWWEGISAREIFEWVMPLNNNNSYWAVWEPGPSGKPIFEYVPWTTSARYYVQPGAADVNLDGGIDALANECLVTYKSSWDQTATTVVVGDEPTLTAAGLTRRIAVDITGEGTVTLARAEQAGADALVKSNLYKSSGKIVVKGPIMDRRTGRWIEPWEIRAGWPIVVSSVPMRFGWEPAIYSAADPYGLTDVYRATSVVYRASSNTAEIELDGGARNWLNRVHPARLDRSRNYAHV